MKVIVAGLPKTGTKSLAKALRMLGMVVYDAEENFGILGNEWLKILAQGSSAEDFLKMYTGVDATCDIPSCCYWKEILKAFPDAKVILMKRNNDSDWFKSLENQLNIMKSSFVFSSLSKLSLTANYLHKLMDLTLNRCLNSKIISCNEKLNSRVLKSIYKKHNEKVEKEVPKEKLLVFKVSEGWKPLCEYLQFDIPKKDFPHENKNGKYGKDETQIKNSGFLIIVIEVCLNSYVILNFLIIWMMIIFTHKSMFHYNFSCKILKEKFKFFLKFS